MKDFQSILVNKVLKLFPSLTEKDVKPYLLHSRATSAYDAVTLLTRSIDMAFGQDGKICDDATAVQVALEKVFLVICVVLYWFVIASYIIPKLSHVFQPT